MNIFHYTGMPTSQKMGGVERWLIAFANKARLRGHKVWLAYTDKLPTDVPSLMAQYSEAGIAVVVTKTMSDAYNLISTENINMVFSHFPEPYLAPYSFKKRYKHVKVYSFFHCSNYYSNLTWKKDFKLKLASLFYRYSVFKTQFYLDGYIAVSKAVKKQFTHGCFLMSNKVLNVYLGVRAFEKSKIRDNKSEDVIRITSIACHESRKGIDILIEAARELKRLGLKFEVNQIGGGMSFNNGKDTEKLHNQARDLEISGHWHWLGVRNDIDDLLEQTDIYVQPSRREAISLTIAEAMMHNLPVVASNVDGIPEYIENGETGILYENNNSNMLAKGILKLINDKNLREKIGIDGGKRIRMNDFNVDFNLDKLFNWCKI